MFEKADQKPILEALKEGDVITMGTPFMRLAPEERMAWKLVAIIKATEKDGAKYVFEVYAFDVLMAVAVATIVEDQVSWGVTQDV